MQVVGYLTGLLATGARTATKRKALDAHRDAAVEDAVAWCVAHGGAYASAGGQPGDPPSFGHAPFALAPFPFPRRAHRALDSRRDRHTKSLPRSS